MLSDLEQSLLLIRAASLLVPARHRKDWRKEWEAEVRYVSWSMCERQDSPSAQRWQLHRFSWGSLQDAISYRFSLLSREDLIRDLRYQTQSPWFCLSAIAGLILLIAIASGGLPMTRAVLSPLPYASSERIATISQGGNFVSVRSGVRTAWVGMWRSESKLLEDAATYAWKDSVVDSHAIVSAWVSDNFFSLLGAGTARGRAFQKGDLVECRDCVVVSYDFWRGRSGGDVAVVLDGRRYRIIGVLPKKFWFLSRHIAVWSIAVPEEKRRTGVVVRIRPEVTKAAAQAELQSIVQDAGVSPWESLVDISPLPARVHSVFGSYALAVSLALIITVAGLRLRLPKLHRGSVRVLFFGCKTGLLLIAVLLAGLEFTRAPSITMLGGTDLLTEPLSTWLFLLGCMGALSWSICDQRGRCRVCARRLGVVARVGCPGCVLLNWAGTELMCIAGHGTLRVPEMTSSWREPEQWTALDDSLLELFAEKS